MGKKAYFRFEYRPRAEAKAELPLALGWDGLCNRVGGPARAVWRETEWGKPHSLPSSPPPCQPSAPALALTWLGLEQAPLFLAGWAWLRPLALSILEQEQSHHEGRQQWGWEWKQVVEGLGGGQWQGSDTGKRGVEGSGWGPRGGVGRPGGQEGGEPPASAFSTTAVGGR